MRIASHALLALLWCVVAGAQAATAVPVYTSTGPDNHHVLVLGRISDDPKAHYKQLRPLLDYVVPRMADVGIREGRILMARDAQQMTSYLRRGRVDWVTETSGTAMLLRTRAGARPLLLTERGGVARYHSVFFARRDSGIDSLADLRGRSIAFQSIGSTSAYFVPAALMLGQGLQLEILLSPLDRPTPESVGYVFARSELNVAAWVHKGLVDAGVVSSQDWEDPRRVPLSFHPDLAIIHRSSDYPRAVEMMRASLDPRVEARLREVLLQAEHDPAGRKAMQAFFGTSRFLPLDADSARDLERVRDAVTRVREQME